MGQNVITLKESIVFGVAVAVVKTILSQPLIGSILRYWL